MIFLVLVSYTAIGSPSSQCSGARFGVTTLTVPALSSYWLHALIKFHNLIYMNTLK